MGEFDHTKYHCLSADRDFGDTMVGSSLKSGVHGCLSNLNVSSALS